MTPLNEEGKELTDEALEDEDPEKAEDEAEEKLVKVTYSATEGGSVTVTSEEIDINAEDAAFEGSEAEADEGYVFAGWYEGSDLVTDDTTFVPEDIDEDTTFTARFDIDETKEEELKLFVKVTYKATEGGSVSNESEEIDVNDSKAKFEGSKAEPLDGYSFVGWEDEDGETVSEKPEFIPENLEKDAAFTAVFEKEEVKMPSVFFRKSANGMSVAIDAPEGAFPEGTTVSVSPVYDSGILEAVKDTVEQEANAGGDESVKTVEKVIAECKIRTPDLGGDASTIDITKAIVKELI